MTFSDSLSGSLLQAFWPCFPLSSTPGNKNPRKNPLCFPAQLQLVQQELFLDVLQLSSVVQQRVDGKHKGITWRFLESPRGELDMVSHPKRRSLVVGQPQAQANLVWGLGGFTHDFL